MNEVHSIRLLRTTMRAAALALPVALVALVVLARRQPVLEEGRLLPWFDTYEHVARVELAGVSLYVDRSSGVADLLTVLALAAIAGLFAAGALAVPRDAALRRTLALAAFGAAYLSADDLLGVHETLGHNLGALASLPLVDHPDDVVMGAYALLALAFAWRHRDLLGGAGRRWWTVAAVSGGLAVAHDVLPLHAGAVEEGLEVVCGAALLIAAVLVLFENVRVARLAAYAAGSTAYRRPIA